MPDTSSSLLLRLRDHGDAEAYERFVHLYGPLLSEWLRRHGLQHHDAADLIQEILQTVAREMPGFQYDRKKGSFRGWLRTIMVNRLRHFRRSTARQTTHDTEFMDHLLTQLEDANSSLARLWDQEHDQHVVSRLLEMVRPEFEGNTWNAFRELMLEGKEVAAVADNLHMTPNAVRVAKYKVLNRLRQESDDLID